MNDLASLAHDIAADGVRATFGITGSGPTLPLLDALERHGVDVVRTQFEGSAALMAGTVGRLSNRAGLTFGIKGPGLANMAPGLAACLLDAFPVVAIVEAYPNAAGPEKAHKRMNHPAFADAVCKGRTVLSGDGPDFPAVARHAEAEVPGPVLLEITGGSERSQPLPAINTVAGDEAAVLAAIAASRRPVVIAGTLAIRRRWSAWLSRLNVPVFSTAAAKGVVDEAGANAAGVYTGVGLKLVPETTLLAEADLVIGLGLRPNEVLTTKPFACPAVNIDSAVVPGAGAFRFAAVAADLTTEIVDALRVHRWGLERLAEILAKLRARLTALPFLPAQAFDGIARRLGRQIRMVMDTGYFCTIGEHHWPAPSADLCLLSGQGRYMGTSVPMALGALVHEPARATIAVVGDGSVGMYVGELRLAVERRLPLLVVLMSDGRYGSVSTRALKDGLTLKPLTIAEPSWARVMEGFGMPAFRASDEAGLDAALAAWRPADGPAYLELSFEPDAYERMVEGIR